jgi:hypothetical protein
MNISSTDCECSHEAAAVRSRLINAQSSTEITHPICLGGLVFGRRYGLVFKRRRVRREALLIRVEVGDLHRLSCRSRRAELRAA